MKKLFLLLIAVCLTILGFSQGKNTFKYAIETPAVTLPGGDVQMQIDAKSNKADTTSLYNLVDRKGYADSLISARFKNLAFVNDSTLSWNVVTGGSTAWYHYTATRDSTTLTPNWSGLLTNLISVWEFDETTGTTAVNGVSGAPDGTASGGVTVNQTGLLGKCWDFDGSTGSINFGKSTIFDLTDNFTIGYFINPTSGPYQQLLIKGGNPGRPYSHFLFCGNVRVYYSTSGNDNKEYDAASSSVSFSAWQTLVFAKSGTSTLIYIDGAYVETLTTLTPLITTTDPLYFCGNGAYFYGLIDELPIWNRVLSSTEIAQWDYNVKHGMDHTSW